jgi:predicted PurR-regulated permease PerM
MRTKNFLQMASIVVLMAIALPASSAVVPSASSLMNNTSSTGGTRAQQLINRLEDIKGMNKSELTRLEKKSLRKEVKGIRKELKNSSGGVYLSVGAIIIIILLLILIL